MLKLVYFRYVLVSAAALGVDMGLFLAALSFGVPSVAAAATGYLSGLVFHWFLSSRAVFAESLADKGLARGQQQAMFVGSALVGLAITMGIVGAGDALGLDPRLAKIAAIGVSFQVTYILRKKFVFAS